jgi:hypothetical protein
MQQQHLHDNSKPEKMVVAFDERAQEKELDLDNTEDTNVQ